MCRREAEYELRRLQRQIAAAEREQQRARYDVAVYGDHGNAAVRLAWWTEEAQALRARLRELLTERADDSDDQESDDGDEVRAHG